MKHLGIGNLQNILRKLSLEAEDVPSSINGLESLFLPEKKIMIYTAKADELGKGEAEEIRQVLQGNFMAARPYLFIWNHTLQFGPETVEARLQSLTGNNRRIFARKLKVVRLNKEDSAVFFNSNHPMRFVSAYYKFGLMHDGEIISAALFSKGRRFVIGEVAKKSFELVRFSTRMGITVSGGFDRLINALKEQVKPDHLMTYHSLEDGAGLVYKRTGFSFANFTEPKEFVLNPETGIVFPKMEIDGKIGDEKSKIVHFRNAGNARFERHF